MFGSLLDEASGDDTEEESAIKLGGYNPELMPFINRPVPKPKPRTVAGYSLKEATSCWNIIKRKKDKFSDGELPSTAAPLLLPKGSELPKVLIKKSELPVLQTENSNELQQRPMTAPVTARVSHIPFISPSVSIPNEGSNDEFTGFDDTDPLGSDKPISAFAQIERARRQLAVMIRKAPFDPDTKNIIPISLKDRVVVFEFRDQLETAYRFQQEEKYEEAELWYSRTIASGKKSTIILPLAMRGVLYFMQKKYFQSVRDFTSAYEHSKALFSISMEDVSLQEKADTAIILYNRALAHFCIGDDDSGINDLKIALKKYDPESHVIRAMLTLAYKRMGRFGNAVAECVGIRSLKERADEKAHLQRMLKYQGAEFNGDHHMSLTRQSTIFPNRDVCVLDAGNRKTISSHRISTINKISKTRGSLSFGPDPGSTYETSTGVSKSISTLSKKSNKIIPTYHVPIAATKFSSSKSSKKSSKGGDSNTSLTLEHEKATQGFTRNIYETLFIRTSQLQDVLTSEPQTRSPDQITEIVKTLKLVPFLHELSVLDLREIAGLVEYRALTTKGQIFGQDQGADVFSIILSGQWQLRLEIAQHLVPLT